jgi:methyl-accepting chemotaxis protein
MRCRNEKTMKLQTKMLTSMACVFMLFMLGLGSALIGMQDAKKRFEVFLDRDQALLQHVSTAYADGLQMGQALRNIVLDPGNKRAYENLSVAASGFERARTDAMGLAGDDTAVSNVLAEVGELRAKQSPVHGRIIEMVAQGNQAAAIQLLNADETPVWREMRARLLAMIKQKNEEVAGIKQDTIELTQRALLISLALGVIAILLGIVVVMWLARNIMKQLGGEPAYAVSIANRVATGNLSESIDVTGAASSSLIQAMALMQAHLTNLVARVRSGADSIASATREIAAGNQDLSSRTEEQASSLQETAASMEQLTSTVRQNADNARQANQLALSATEVAEAGGTVVSRVVDTMASINGSSSKIVDIIGVINDIAFQTNILALNAAVEAARAGEQGRGFAVVASEVRSLAQRSAEAAKEIKALIDGSVQEVGVGAELVDQAGATMREIVVSVKRVSDIIGEIAAASEEQSAGIEQVNQAVMQMDHVTQQNAALVEEAAAASDALQDQARELADTVGAFELESARVATISESRAKTAPVLTAMAATPALRSPTRPHAVAEAEWEEF